MGVTPKQLQGYRKGQSRETRAKTEPAESAKPERIWHSGTPKNLRSDGLTILVCSVVVFVIVVALFIDLITGPHSIHPLLP